MTRDIFMYEWKKYKEHYDILEDGEYRIHDDAPDHVKESFREYDNMINKVKHFSSDRVHLFDSFSGNAKAVKKGMKPKKAKRDDEYTQSVDALRDVMKEVEHPQTSKVERVEKTTSNTILMIQDIDAKIAVATKVLDALPAYFGIEEAKQEYINKSAMLPFWCAKNNEEEVGFITIKKTMPKCAELYVMGVLSEYHHQHIGSDLLYHAELWCKENGFAYLQVKTLSDDSDDINYAKTRAFYEANGFVGVEVFPTLWDKRNPCLLLIKKIA